MGSRRPRVGPLPTVLAVALCACLAAAPSFGAHVQWDQNHDPTQPQGGPPPDGNTPICNPAASPFEVATGNFFYRFEDFSANVLGPELRFTRTYNSRDPRRGSLGVGWTHTYDVRLLEVTDGVAISALCRKDTGKRFSFVRNPDGSYSPQPDFFSELIRLPDGTYSLKEPDGTTSLFDADGFLTAIRDRDGNELTLGYDATGFLTTVTSAAGAQIVLTKGADGKIASVTDPRGKVFDYGYDTEGRLTSVTNPLGEETTFGYGTDGKLAQILDSLGRTVQDLSYDAEGRLTGYIENGVAWTVAYSPTESKTTKTGPLGEDWELHYNQHGNVVKRANPLGGEQVFEYDENNRLITITDESDGKTGYSHDEFGNVASRTDAEGHLTTWDYDSASGRLLSMTNGINETTENVYQAGRLSEVRDDEGLLYRLEYYPSGLVHSWIDPNDRATVFTYNTEGLLQSATEPGGGQTTFEYDAAGNLTAEVDPDGRRVEFEYDELGREVLRRDPAGNEVRFEYAAVCPVCLANDRLTSVVDASGRETRWEYDEFGRPLKMIHADLTEIEWTYDARGEMASRVERDESETLFTYDPLGRLETVEEPGGGVSTISYDPAGRVIGVVGPEGAATDFAPDKIGRLLSVTTGEAGVTTATYKGNGLLASRTDARGIQTSYLYDRRGRMVTESFPDAEENVVYRWDEAASSNGRGRLTSVDDAAGLARYHYDENGRLARVESSHQGVSLSTHYDYSPGGLITEVTYPSGIRVTYSRDTRGLVDGVEMDNAGSRTVLVSSVSYDPDGRPETIAYGNGLDESRAYDAVGRVSSISVGAVDQVVYSRDLLGNVTALTDQLDPTRNRSYDYDQLGRLTSATGPWGPLSFTYDKAGNRLTRTDASGTATYLYDGVKLDTISGAESANYAYDAAGNVLSNGVLDYAYSQSGRLASVIEGGIEQASYRYNSSHQRIVKEAAAGATIFAYDLEGRVIEEYDALGSVLVSYVYLDGWRPLAQVISGDVFVYHVDHTDLPRALTDQGQNEVWRGEFYPFGELYQEAGTVSQNIRFPGQMRDMEARLDYNWNRWYEPRIGRYTSPDPIGLRGGINPFLYAFANPMSFVDPRGLQTAEVCCRPVGGRPSVRWMNNILAALNKPQANHCYVRQVDDNGNTSATWSLINTDGVALPSFDHPSDFDYAPQPGECGDPICMSNGMQRCLNSQTGGYPVRPYPFGAGVTPLTGVTSSTFGPNSNSFAQHVSMVCGVNMPSFISSMAHPGWFYWPSAGRYP